MLGSLLSIPWESNVEKDQYFEICLSKFSVIQSVPDNHIQICHAKVELGGRSPAARYHPLVSLYLS